MAEVLEEFVDKILKLDLHESKEPQNYQEPYWSHTSLMESMFLREIASAQKALRIEQMAYVLGDNELNTRLILDHLIEEGFLKKEAQSYYLDKLGIHHAKRRLGTFRESLIEWRAGKVEDWKIGMLLSLYEKYIGRIKEIQEGKTLEGAKPTEEAKQVKAPTGKLEDLESRISQLEEKFKRMKDILEK